MLSNTRLRSFQFQRSYYCVKMRPTCLHLFLSLLFEVLLFRGNFIFAISIFPIDLDQNIDDDNENTTTSSVKSEDTLEDPSVFFKSIKPIEDEARSKRSLDGPDIYAKSIRTAIEVSSHVKCPKPLTFFTALDETALVNQTARSLDVRLINPVTVATMTGGIFGNNLYELHRYQFFWQKCSCNTTHNLDARVYYFNLKYESYEKALDYSDGVVIINLPIATNRDFPNPRFDPFSKVIQSKIKEPGCWTKVRSAFTYSGS
ncbi:uncharacterized protein LOC135837047 [Planococcus citri]|uniref:uncharacterized protein LOC135837047 n=1 Tax=Planococcus citri TaxID=170843 RepID=UPI0031F8D92D